MSLENGLTRVGGDSVSAHHFTPVPTTALLVVAKYKDHTTAFVFITVFTSLFVYLGLLLRDLDDPFDYTPNQHLSALETGVSAPVTLYSAMSNGSSIDFAILTLEFGQQLRALIAACELDELTKPHAPAPATVVAVEAEHRERESSSRQVHPAG